MAVFPVKFPTGWPDLVVTSYNNPRPAHPSPSHAAGYAYDLALVENAATGNSKDIGSPYWFYYFYTFLIMWGSQRNGVSRIAIPTDTGAPVCLHYHLEARKDTNAVGFESIQKDSHGNCFATHVAQVSLDNYEKSEKFGEKFREWFKLFMGSDFSYYIQNFAAGFRDIGGATGPVAIRAGAGISDSQLQDFIDFQFTGSKLVAVLDKVANILGYKTFTEPLPYAPAGLGGLAVLGVLAYFLANYADKKDPSGPRVPENG